MPPIDEPLPRISAVTLKTADMAPSVAFYEALGFGRLYRGREADLTSLAVGSGLLNRQLDRDSGPDAVWRVIFWVDDVESMYRRAGRPAQYRSLRPPTRPRASAISICTTPTGTSRASPKTL